MILITRAPLAETLHIVTVHTVITQILDRHLCPFGF